MGMKKKIKETDRGMADQKPFPHSFTLGLKSALLYFGALCFCVFLVLYFVSLLAIPICC